MKKFPLVTVAVITRNRAESLKRTLQAISELNYPNFEVIVVDNDSRDHTKQIIDVFGFIYFFSPKSNGFAKTRQLAVDAARGEFLLWCDDDAIPVIGWIDAYVKRFQSDILIGAIGGQIINHGFADYLLNKGTQIVGKNGVLVRVGNGEKASVYSNLNLGIKTSVLKRLGGYDPFFKGGYEEVDLLLRIRSSEIKIVYEKSALVNHYHSQIAYKRGRFFWGSQMMRLYLYYRHIETLKNDSFFRDEMILFKKDMIRNTRILFSAIKRKNFSIYFIGLIEFFNSISSRLLIPWIRFRAFNNCSKKIGDET